MTTTNGGLLSTLDNWAVTCDFQQCGILTGVDPDQPVQHPFKLRNSKCFSASSWTFIEYSSDLQRLWSDCAYAQAGLSLCWSHIPQCWKSHVTAQLLLTWTLRIKSNKTSHNLEASTCGPLNHTMGSHIPFVSTSMGKPSEYKGLKVLVNLLIHWKWSLNSYLLRFVSLREWNKFNKRLSIHYTKGIKRRSELVFRFPCKQCTSSSASVIRS